MICVGWAGDCGSCIFGLGRVRRLLSHLCSFYHLPLARTIRWSHVMLRHVASATEFSTPIVIKYALDSCLTRFTFGRIRVSGGVCILLNN